MCMQDSQDKPTLHSPLQRMSSEEQRRAGLGYRAFKKFGSRATKPAMQILRTGAFDSPDSSEEEFLAIVEQQMDSNT